MVRHRAAGIVGVLFGALALFMFVRTPHHRLIIPDSTFFFVRHFIGITLVDVSIAFIAFGILTYIGVLVPHYAVKATELTRARNNVLGALLLLPFWASFFCTLAILSESVQWKVVGFAMFIGLCAMTIRGVQTLRGK